MSLYYLRFYTFSYFVLRRSVIINNSKIIHLTNTVQIHIIYWVAVKAIINK